MTADLNGEARPSAAAPPDRDFQQVELLAPTLLEFLTLRLARPASPVRRAGMRLSRWTPPSEGGAVVVCGVAGALAADLAPGDVLIPDVVHSSDGDSRVCDPRLTGALRAAARSLGFNPIRGSLLTADNIVTGPERERWAARGFVAADMEAARVPPNLRVATVRVILDAPWRSISAKWDHPARALVRPEMWVELAWLARFAPVFAYRAARIAEAGLRHPDAG